MFAFFLFSATFSLAQDCRNNFTTEFRGQSNNTLCDISNGEGGPGGFVEIGAATPYPTASSIDFIPTKVFVRGNFFIDVPSVFNDVEFKINTNIAIRMSPNVSLELNACDLYACEDMWRGIFLNNGCKVILNTGTQIEDALTALNSTNMSSTSFDLSDCTFNRNDIGVFLKKEILGISTPTFSKMTNVNFTCDSPLNLGENQISHAGIKAQGHKIVCDLKGVIFNGLQKGIISTSGSKSFIAGKEAVFEDIREDGIYLKFAEFQIDDFEFRNCGDSGIRLDKSSFFSMTNSTFYMDDDISPIQGSETEHFGVIINNYDSEAIVEIKDCDFSNNTNSNRSVTHIYLENKFTNFSSIRTLIEDNLFDLFGYSSTGIYVSGPFYSSSNTQLRLNDFLFSGTENVIQGASTGIDINSFQMHNLKINYNNFKVSRKRKINDIGINLEGSLLGMLNEVKDNGFRNMSIDLIPKDCDLDPTDFTNFSPFDTGFKPCIKVKNFHNTAFSCNKNNKSGSMFVFDGYLEGIDFHENSSTYGQLIRIQPFSSIGDKESQGNTFEPVGAEEPVFYPIQASLAYPPDANLSRFIINEEQVSDYCSDYSRLHPVTVIPDNNDEWWVFITTAPVPSSTCNQSLQGPVANGNMNRYINVANGRFENYLPSSEALAIEKRKTYFYLKNNPDLLLLDHTFQKFINENTIYGELFEIQHDLKSFYSGNLNLDDLSSSLELNNSIEERIIPIANEKEMNRIILQSLINQSEEVILENIASIRDIAIQCPNKGGYSVYVARQMLPNCEAYNDCTYDLGELGSLPTPRTSEPSEYSDLHKSYNIELFPNPTKDLVNITVNQAGLIEIFNFQGMKIIEKQVEESCQIDLSSFAAGVYHYKFSIDQNLVKQGSLSVLK